MTDIANALYRVADVRRIEARAMSMSGCDAWALMQRAGAAAFTMLRQRWPLARQLVVACGNGNNGGDGYVVATLARAAGFKVSVVRIGATPVCEPAATALAHWRDAGGEVIALGQNELPEADVIVDALFGIGLDRAPDGQSLAAIEAINRHPAPVFALDVPSGLNADTGDAPGACVRATQTLSFIAWKRGLWTGVAARYCGERCNATLEVTAAAFADVESDARLVRDQERVKALRPRDRDAHKGQCGHVLVVGGECGFGGAVLIAAIAAARSGAGRVSVATRSVHVSAILARAPELMARAVIDAEEIQPLIASADVIALGPGLAQSAWSVMLAEAACASGKPLVLDADALNLLAAGRIRTRGDVVMTPHPGEAARLLATDTATIARDRYAAVRALAQRHRATVVLKGAGSLIADPDGRIAVCPLGNPGMASGGMGDALTGIIAAFIAQGMDITQAATIGTVVHARAADLAADGQERGLLASDVIAQLRAVVNP